MFNSLTCRWSRKGGNTSAAEWALRLGPYVEGWTHADEEGHVWTEHRPFSPAEYQRYLSWYVPRTRVFLVRSTENEEIHAGPSGGYPFHSAEQRHELVSNNIYITSIVLSCYNFLTSVLDLTGLVSGAG